MTLGSFKTFFEKVGDALKKVFGAKATWEQTAIAVIKYVGPLVGTIVALVDPAAAPLVSGIIAEVQSDLATVYAVASGAAAPSGATDVQTIQSALASVKANFASLLTAAGVKNSANAAKVTAVANAITGEVDALLSNLPTPAPAAS